MGGKNVIQKKEFYKERRKRKKSSVPAKSKEKKSTESFGENKVERDYGDT